MRNARHLVFDGSQFADVVDVLAASQAALLETDEMAGITAAQIISADEAEAVLRSLASVFSEEMVHSEDVGNENALGNLSPCNAG